VLVVTVFGKRTRAEARDYISVLWLTPQVAAFKFRNAATSDLQPPIGFYVFLLVVPVTIPVVVIITSAVTEALRDKARQVHVGKSEDVKLVRVGDRPTR